MTTIELFANDQLLQVTVNPTISSGEQNTVEVHVYFSDDWDGFSKSAVFFTSLNKNAMHLKENIVRECAELYSLPINDCRFSWFNATNPENLAKYSKTDNLHLSDDGNDRLWNVDLENAVNNLKFSRVE